MATTDTLKNDQDEFNAAFAEPEAEKPEVSEDEAFGLSEPEEIPDEAEAEIIEEPAADSPVEEVTEPQVEVEVESAKGEPGSPLTPDEQREKSWEGRLKAREAELKAWEEALKARESGMHNEAEESPEHEAAEPEVVEAVEDAVEKVESGEMSVDEALKTLGEDFGPEFAKVLEVLVTAKAKEATASITDKIGSINKTVEDLIADITDDKTRSHFETIASKHPDFMEVSEGELMQNYLAGLPEADRSAAEHIISEGSSKDIIKLLDAVKASAPKEEVVVEVEPDNQHAMDAAEGVRSKGLKLPEKPVASDDYEAAWDSF